MTGHIIPSTRHFCDIPARGQKGSIWVCDFCDEKWYCKPIPYMGPEYRYGNWVQISESEFAKLTGALADVSARAKVGVYSQAGVLKDQPKPVKAEPKVHWRRLKRKFGII